MNQQSTNTPATPPVRKWGASWAVAVVLIAIVLVVGAPLGIAFLMWNRAAIKAPGQITGAMRDFAADVMRPQTTVNEVVFASIQDMQRKQKLVVLETTVDVDVTREEGSTSWGMYWGTNVARVAVKDAHVQYYIDLTGLGTADFTYNDTAKTLVVSVPPPRLDTTMISIDPAKIQTLDLRGGWARWDKQDTRDSAIGELRPKIIIQGSTPFMQKQAQDAGKNAIVQFLKPLVENLSKEGVKMDVVYRSGM